MEELEALISNYEAYVQLLGEEINEMSGLMIVHGWTSSRVERGKECRRRIKYAIRKAREAVT